MARSLVAIGVALGALCTALQARADLDLHRLGKAMGARATLPSLLHNEGDRVALLLSRSHSSVPFPHGAFALNDEFAAIELERDAALELAGVHEDLRISWTPPLRWSLDRASAWVHAPSYRQRTGGTGQGVVVGIVDTGIDLKHPDFLNSDGTTRVRWLLDLSRPAAGLQPELEEHFGCSRGGASNFDCAVYSAADLDRLLNNDLAGDEPQDRVGHGTHVASLAIGNGRASDGAWTGIAPEADLVIARVAAGDAAISDAKIARAVAFIFDRAEELGEPAVVNLSVGSDFGPHDGSSTIERALTSFVGPNHPGRAIVVAAGNSGGLLRGVSSEYPGPFGPHTELHVAAGSTAKVPILSPSSGNTVRGRFTVWIAHRFGDRLSIAVERAGQRISELVAPGVADAWSVESLVVMIANENQVATEQAAGASAVVVEGEWRAGEVFTLHFEGHGTPTLWVTSEDEAANGAGMVFPFAQKEGTISVPASAPELIAVGATLNRTSWINVNGREVQLTHNGAVEVADADSIAFFSAAGPNALGVMKPDIVAPGYRVIGAMSALADPRSGRATMFSGGTECPANPNCFVVDDHYAVASGTSMAAPIVTGGIALLFERDAGLTQPAIRSLLQAGARRPEGSVALEQQLGIGVLDLAGTLDAQLLETNPAERQPSASSFWSFAAAFLRPDPNWSLQAQLELRDAAGRIADGFDPARLSVVLSAGKLTRPLRRLAPGLYEFALSAPERSGGGQLTVDLLFDREVLLTRTLDIAVDPGADTSAVRLRGGCSMLRLDNQVDSSAAWIVGFLLALGRLTGRRPQSRPAHEAKW